MSQEKLRIMLESAETRIEKRSSERHLEILKRIDNLSADFKAHMKEDVAQRNDLQNQISAIYKTAAGIFLGAFVWAWNWITK